MKKVAVYFLTVFLVMVFSMHRANAFDGNDYGGGGGDGGGGYGGGGWDSDSDSDSEGGDLWVFLAIVGTIVLFGIYSGVRDKMKGQDGQTRPSSSQGLHIQLPDRTSEIEDIMRGHDPNFSASDFVSFVKRVYIDIQTAWCKRDLLPVRIFLHDNLHDATLKQIQEKIDQGVVYHYESMVVGTAYLTSYAKDKQFEYLTLYLNARMIDWQEDEKTGKIIRGDKTTRWDLRYKMKFMRSTEVLTKEAADSATGHNCPNCGAPLEMASSTKCAYCGAIVTTGKYSWVLSDFGTIRNDTVDEGIKMESNT